MDFDFTYADGTTWDQMIAFEMAGELWSDYLGDNMTVNIHVEMTDILPDNVIGGALPAMVNDVSYADFRNAYEADAGAWEKENVFTGLPLIHEYGKEKFQARVDLGYKSYIEDSSSLDMTRANAKALGIDAVDSHSTELDGYIMMSDLSNSSASWSYNPWWTGNNQLDFFSVAVHEVGHILGFVSGVDKAQGLYFESSNQESEYFANSSMSLKNYLDSALDRANPLDLFRYSTESQAMDSSNNTIDMSPGSDAFFARRGQNRYWNFARGKNNDFRGDGYQASHWQNNNEESRVSGIMDPVLKVGMRRMITNRDLVVMNTIGYNPTSKAFEVEEQSNRDNGWLAADRSNQLISHLQWHAKNNIVKSVYSDGEASWFDTWRNSTPNADDYTVHLTTNRDDKVKTMLDRSEVYEAGRRRRGSYTNWQEAYFNEFTWQELNESMTQSLVVDYVIDNSVDVEVKSPEVTVENFDNLPLSDSNYSVTKTEVQLLDRDNAEAIADSQLNFTSVQDLIAEMAQLPLAEAIL